MKTLVLSMISIAATVAAMTACTSESDPINDITNPQDGKVEINATAGIGEIATKTAGVVNKGAEMDNIGFVRIDSKDAISWSTASLTDITATMATAGTITFGESQFFDSDANIKTNLIGYHPQTNGTRTNNEVTYTIDGQQDIMCTSAVVGDKTTNKTTPMKFAFDHLLTQFSFQVKAENAAAAKAWGDITSMELINQKTSAKITLDTKTITFTDASANQKIAIGSTTKSFDSSDPTTPVGYGNPIIVEAGLANYTVNVKTTKFPTGIDVKLSVTNAAASTSYVVTLTFKATTVNGEATIGEWTSSTGEGEVQ